VLKAYRELEHHGLVEARRGLGTFIRHDLDQETANRPELKASLVEWIHSAQADGLSIADVRALFASVTDEHFL
jgi:GntR family transcriptional regulator